MSSPNNKSSSSSSSYLGLYSFADQMKDKKEADLLIKKLQELFKNNPEMSKKAAVILECWLSKKKRGP